VVTVEFVQDLKFGRIASWLLVCGFGCVAGIWYLVIGICRGREEIVELQPVIRYRHHKYQIPNTKYQVPGQKRAAGS